MHLQRKNPLWIHFRTALFPRRAPIWILEFKPKSPKEEGKSTKWLCFRCNFEAERDAKKEDDSMYGQVWLERYEHLQREQRYEEALAAAKRFLVRKAEVPPGGR